MFLINTKQLAGLLPSKYGDLPEHDLTSLLVNGWQNELLDDDGDFLARVVWVVHQLGLFLAEPKKFLAHEVEVRQEA